MNTNESIKTPESLSKPSQLFFWLFFISCFASLVLAGWCLYNYNVIKYGIIDNTKNNAQQQTDKAAQEINDFLLLLQPIVDSIAQEFRTGALPADQIIERIQQKAFNVTGIGVAFAPYAVDPNKQWYAPYYVEREGKQELVYLENFYDYTTFERYKQPMERGAGFLEPFFDPASKTIVAEYTAPLYDQNNNKIGVIFANHSTEHMKYIIVDKIHLGYKGYGFVISKNGTYVAHPIRDYVAKPYTIFEIAKKFNSKGLEEMAEHAVKGERGFIESEDLWTFFEPITASGWSMGSVFSKDELPLYTMQLKRKFINCVLLLLSFIMFLLLLLFGVYKLTDRKLLYGSFIISLSLFAGIVFMWYMAHITIRYQIEEEESVIITDRTSLVRFIETVETGNSTPQPSPLPVSSLTQQLSLNNNSSSLFLYQMMDVLGSFNDSLEATDEPVTMQAIQQGLQKVMSHLQQASDIIYQQPAMTQQLQAPAPMPTTQAHTALPHAQAESTPMAATNVQQLTPAAVTHGGHGGGHGAHPEKPATTAYMQIPTGLYLQNLDFKGSSGIKIIGQFWQRFTPDQLTTVKPGVIFPNGDPVKMTEAYKFEDETTTLGWNAQAEIAQGFSFDNYPFDTRLVKINIWPADFDKEVMLIPDLDAYKILLPEALPGLDPNIKLQEWFIDKSFFSYKKQKYLTNFGNYVTGAFGTFEKSKKSVVPELVYNVTLRRYTFGSLILDLIPIVIMLLIIFSILVMFHADLFDSAFNIYANTVPIFFSIIVAHQRFKSSVPVQQIVFFEYFYFILHFLNAAVTLLTIMLLMQVGTAFISYRKLFIPTILFWPIATFMIFIQSLAFFY